MTRLGEAGLTEPPLDADFLPRWLAYLNAWDAGNRKAKMAALSTFIMQLTDSKHSETFAWWVCRAFFDLSPY